MNDVQLENVPSTTLEGTQAVKVYIGGKGWRPRKTTLNALKTFFGIGSVDLENVTTNIIIVDASKSLILTCPQDNTLHKIVIVKDEEGNYSINHEIYTP
jgi:hypothetical protein